MAMSDAEKKRAQREREKRWQRQTGHAFMSADTIQHAILDALSQMIRSGDPDGHVAAVLAAAGAAYAVPEQASCAMYKRLSTRQPKILRLAD